MRPSFLEEMSWAMGEVYAEVVDRILINLAHYFPYIKDGKEPKGSFEYQARMLAQMGQVNRETAAIIRDGLKGADAALKDGLEAAILESLRSEEPKLRKAAEKGLLQGAGFLPPEVDPGQMQAFKSYYRQSADKLNLVNTVMLESTEQAYQATVSDIVNRVNGTQRILNAATGEAVTGASTWNQAVRHAVDRMVENGLTGFVDHAGHRWRPETYAAMDIKTTMFNTARAAVWERNEQYGNDLYQVSSHNGARPLCYPWQGKVISRADRSGTVEDLDGNQVEIWPQSQTSYGQAAGLFGVNCKHYPMTFIPGFSTLRGQPQDPEENEKAYAESQEQRRLERELREKRLKVEQLKAQGAPEEEIKAAKAKAREASSRVQEFCDETGRTRRRNREGTPVMASWKGAEKGPFAYKQISTLTQPSVGGSIEAGIRYRRGNPVAPTEVTLDMALNKQEHAAAIVKKYGIHLKAGGKPVKIVVVNQRVMGKYGFTRKDVPNTIHLYLNAFDSEVELANTIAHELNHNRSFARGGNAPEEVAYAAGTALSEFIEGVR